MKTTLALAVVLAVGACKGKDAAPAKDQPAPAPKVEDKPAEPAAAKPADPAAAVDPATQELAAKLTLKDPAVCIGFTAGGKGAYFVTKSMDNGSDTFALVAVGDAPKPNVDSLTLQGDVAPDLKARDAFVAKITTEIGKQQLTSCSQWQKKDKSVTAQLAGKDVTVSTKGTKIKVETKGGITLEKDMEGGAEGAYVDSAYSSSDFNSIAVVVNSTAEAMSNYDVVFIAAGDLQKK